MTSTGERTPPRLPDLAAGGSGARPPGRGPRRGRRVGILVAGAVLALGLGGVLLAPRSGLTAQPQVAAGAGDAGATLRSSTPAAARTTGRTHAPDGTHALGGPITITAPRVTTRTPRLTWAPPRLTNPATETVTADHTNLKLDPTRDYTVVLPRTDVTLTAGVTITGGHNVVIIGGTLHVPARGTTADDKHRRGFYLKGQTGTIHIEGVRITGDVSDGFNLDEREGAIVQIENVRVDLVHGSHDTHHADVLQTWAGPRILRVDGLRGATEYQGLFLLPQQQWSDGPAPESFVFKRTVLSMMAGSAYAVWLPDRSPPWMDYSGITVRVGGDAATDKLTWPDSSLGVAVVNADEAVDLPTGVPGGGYRSPGYLQEPGY